MATIEKAELKILVANNIGSDIENLLEVAIRHRDQQTGGKQALVAASRSVANLAEHFRKCVEDGEIKLDGLEAQEVQALVFRYITRASGIAENMATSAQAQENVADGMIAAYRRAMQVPSKMIAEEQCKKNAALAALNNTIEEGEVDPRRPKMRTTGVHPGSPLKDRHPAQTDEKPMANEETPIEKKPGKKRPK